MPALGMAQDTGKVLRWLKPDGASVAKGEPVMEIETDKVTVEIEAPADGTLAGIRAAEGEEVPVGQVVAVVLAPGEEPPDPEPRITREVEAVAASPAPDGAAPAEPAPAPTGRRPLASPKARRLAAERGVDVESVAGSGPGGAVVAADVDAAVSADAEVEAAPEAAPEVGSVWRVMAERTTQSWQTVPHFYLRREVDATRFLSWREAARRRPGCEDLSPTDLLVRVAAEALLRHPRVAASWRDGKLVSADRVAVAVAVATDAGLVAPVVHDAERLDLPAIVARRKEIVAAARNGRLRPDDVSGGTFTISNLGGHGVDEFDAVVNAPQSAILAVGRILERVVSVAGQPAVRPTLKLTLSFDHRAVDGVRGAEFVDTLAALIEEPAGMVN